jgi:hypothetical protein
VDKLRLRTNGRQDRRPDGRTRWFQYTPPNFVAGGIKIIHHESVHMGLMKSHPRDWIFWWGTRQASSLAKIFNPSGEISLISHGYSWSILIISNNIISNSPEISKDYLALSTMFTWFKLNSDQFPVCWT